MSRSTNLSQSRLGKQPSKARIQRVADAFDPAMLTHICTTWDFDAYATRVNLPGRDRFYYYQDNGSDILAVAHLDSVQGEVECVVVDTAAGPLVVSGSLDDRLGAYVILELLPALGMTCDILLTTDEERGRSTAREFAEDYDGKQYNWVIEFDRGGTDVVMYQYETAANVALVEESGARVGEGSFSDIAELDDLGCAAFNWGVGYEDYHGPRAHAWLADTFKMVARFWRFHEANAETFLPHDPRLAYEDDRGDLDWLFYDCPDAIEAECGHLVDLGDRDTYTEFGTTNAIVCMKCSIAA